MMDCWGAVQPSRWRAREGAGRDGEGQQEERQRKRKMAMEPAMTLIKRNWRVEWTGQDRTGLDRDGVRRAGAGSREEPLEQPATRLLGGRGWRGCARSQGRLKLARWELGWAGLGRAGLLLAVLLLGRAPGCAAALPSHGQAVGRPSALCWGKLSGCGDVKVPVCLSASRSQSGIVDWVPCVSGGKGR